MVSQVFLASSPL
jgi:hypothetical protein